MRMPRSVRDADVSGKTVLVRSDLNVPLEDGEVADDMRIRASLPTLRLLLESGAAEVRVCSHLGRPKTDEDREKYSMKPVEARLRELLPDDRLKVLENTRFDPRETKNDPAFAQELAEGCDLYVNDAFGSAHRAHASTEGVAHLLPAYAGLLLEEELKNLCKLLGDVERPFVIVSGGAKVDDKLGVLQNLGGRADTVLVGGKMAEQMRVDNPLDFEVELPSDVVGASEFAEDAESGIFTVEDLPAGWLGLDIGPQTRADFSERISAARTVFWNGPMGVFELAPFARGTIAVARAVAASQATSVVGGGDSVAAVNAAGVADRITHVSTGGGAALELVEGRVLPGVQALEAAAAAS
jgi:phosphoglycerate kinase